MIVDGGGNFESGSTLNLNIQYTSKKASLSLGADESSFAEDAEYDDEEVNASSSSSSSSGLIIVPSLLTSKTMSEKVSDQPVRKSTASKSVADKSDAAKKTSPRMTVPSALGEKRVFSGAMGLNDSSDKAKSYKTAIRLEKLGKLENVVGDIVKAINSYDTKLLEHLVHEFVRFDCELVTPRAVLYGRKHFLLYFDTLLNCIPDFVIVAKRPVIDRSKHQIQCGIHFTGTKVSSLNDHLLKPSGCTLTEPPSYMSAISKSTLTQSKLSFLDRVESVYNSTGNLYLLYGTGSWIIDYDPESLDVIKFEMKYALSSFKKQLH